MNPKTLASPPKHFYGWFALAGAMLVIFITGGCFYHSYSVFLPVLCEQFGWNRAEVSLGLTISVMFFGLPSPLFGVLVARYGSRICVILGNLLAAIGLIAMSQVQAVWQLYLCYFIIGLGGGLGGQIALTTVVNNWFVKRRSLALGMFVACGGLAGFVFPPLTTVLISAWDWRPAYLALGGILFLLATVAGGIILIKNKPEELGQAPDGIAEKVSHPATIKEKKTELNLKKIGAQIKQALGLRTTWMIVAFTAANSLVIGTTAAHLVAYFKDIGFAPMSAAIMMSVMSAFGIAGSILFGVLALRYRLKHLAGICFVIQIAALAILLITRNTGASYLAVAMLGISGNALATAALIFIGSYFPRSLYSQILGVVYPFQLIAQAAAPTIAGAIFDATKTYTPDFLLLTVTSLAGLAVVLSAKHPKQPQSV